MPTDPATRRKGAHFLSGSPDVVGRIVAAAAVRPGESVVDVGSGPGIITRALAEAVGAHGKVLAIENDSAWAVDLKRAAPSNVRVVEGDALAVRLPDRIDAVVANPPFRILPGLVRRLLDHGFGRAVLVVPDEFRERLLAEPGSDAYGKLTIQVGARAKAKLLFPLRRRDFDPPPDVPCHVLQLAPKPAAEGACDWRLLDLVLDTAWPERRRLLRNALGGLAPALGVPEAAVARALEATPAGGRAVHEASPWEYVALTQALQREVAAHRAGSDGPAPDAADGPSGQPSRDATTDPAGPSPRA